MTNFARLALCLALLPSAVMNAQSRAAPGPWELQSSATKANLRGIHAVGNGVAWASGANGTVLRTEDGGYMWQSCAMPPGAEKLDFRGIRAWDANIAVVMSSGPDGQSRLYRTADGCSNWQMVYVNPDKTGFWDILVFLDARNGVVVGDPVPDTLGNRKLAVFSTHDAGENWSSVASTFAPLAGEAIFAASNSAAAFYSGRLWVGTSRDRLLNIALRPPSFRSAGVAGVCKGLEPECGLVWNEWKSSFVPLASGNDSSGVFSLAFRDQDHGIAVGGDYKQPNKPQGTAAYTTNGGKTWIESTKPPHGYRSAVAWDDKDKAWITVGTNGSDVSYDDGKTWITLDTGNWNALSLPWVVGPEGRIAKLVSLKPAAK